MLAAMRRDKRLYFALFGAIGGGLSGLGFHLVDTRVPIWSWIVGGVLDGLAIAFVLVVAQSAYVGRGLALPRAIRPAAIGAIGGAVGGLAAFYLGFPIADMLGLGGNARRALGWAISGGVVGYALSTAVPNLSRRGATLAGALGGGAGCYTMYVVGYTAGVAVTGAAIGLAIAIAEVAMRRHWLEITIRPKGLSLEKERTIEVTLGPDPVLIGCGRNADVRLSEVEGRKPDFAEVRLQRGSAVLTDLHDESRHVLAQGQPYALANAMLTLRAGR